MLLNILGQKSRTDARVAGSDYENVLERVGKERIGQLCRRQTRLSIWIGLGSGR